MQERRQTIERLHRKYAGVLYDKCARMLRDRQEAEDAVQETFVNAYRALDRFTYGESQLPWLYRIATNVCLQFLRTRRRKGLVLVAEVEPERVGPEDETRVLAARQVIERMAASLDPRSQEILVAHYIDGMDQGQIAKSLGISRRAVVKRLTALRRRFSQMLEVEADV